MRPDLLLKYAVISNYILLRINNILQVYIYYFRCPSSNLKCQIYLKNDYLDNYPNIKKILFKNNGCYFYNYLLISM
jgi:uncharacterized membrane protein YobD (UPF0266 family)